MASESKTVVVSRGLGLSTILFLVFLVLQLTGQIDWPWYAIAAPLWISWGLWAVLIGLFIVIAALAKD